MGCLKIILIFHVSVAIYNSILVNPQVILRPSLPTQLAISIESR